jgi:hypothetical protein
VAELKELADQQGIDIPHDARKADIIEALEKGSKGEGSEKSPKEGNVYLYNTSSTTEAHMTPDDHWKLKLTV